VVSKVQWNSYLLTTIQVYLPTIITNHRSSKPSELGKRACVFHASGAAAAMFSGYLQAAVYTGLNGTLGKAGWQW